MANTLVGPEEIEAALVETPRLHSMFVRSSPAFARLVKIACVEDGTKIVDFVQNALAKALRERYLRMA